MAAGFEYFDSTMSGAPILRYGAGYWAAILDWVLTGKGGWATEFTGTNLRAYRSNTGNRFRLRLDDTQAAYARLRGYRSMTGISAGLTSPFPSAAQNATASGGLRKGYDSLGITAHAYYGIRTDRYVVIVYEQTLPNIPSYMGLFIFGDVPSLCEADSHNTLIHILPGANTQYYTPWYNLVANPIGPTLPSFTGAAGFSGTPNGAVVAPQAMLHLGFFGGVSAAHAPAVVQSGRTSFAPFIASNGNSATASAGIYPRSLVPNVQHLFGPAGNYSDVNMPCQHGIPFSIGARDFMPLLYQHGGVGAGGYAGDTLLLEMTDTDGAL